MKHLKTFESFINETDNSEEIFEANKEFKDLSKNDVTEFAKLIKLDPKFVTKLIKELSYNTINKKFLIIGPNGMREDYAQALKGDINDNIDAVIKYVLKKFPDATHIKIPTGHLEYDIAAKKWLDAY